MKEHEKNLIELVKSHNIFLLKNYIKANPNISLHFTDNKGKTLLHHVFHKNSENILYLIQYLLEQDISPNCVDEKFETPLDVAKKYDLKTIISMFNSFLENKKQEEIGFISY